MPPVIGTSVADAAFYEYGWFTESSLLPTTPASFGHFYEYGWLTEHSILPTVVSPDGSYEVYANIVVEPFGPTRGSSSPNAAFYEYGWFTELSLLGVAASTGSYEIYANLVNQIGGLFNDFAAWRPTLAETDPFISSASLPGR